MKTSLFRSPPIGFTLLETLCALAIVSLLFVVTAQIVDSASAWSGSARRLLSTSGQTRTAMDRLAGDLAARIRNPRQSLHVIKSSQGNDALQILADVRSTSATSRFSAVTYAVQDISSASSRMEPQLFRALTPIEWTDEPQAALGLLPAPQPGDVFSEGCFRLELTFLLKNGELKATVPTDIDQIAAVVVGVAMLDASTRSKLSVEQLAALAASLPDVADGATPLEAWSAASLSGPAGREVRFSQRTFLLNAGGLF